MWEKVDVETSPQCSHSHQELVLPVWCILLDKRLEHSSGSLLEYSNSVHREWWSSRSGWWWWRGRSGGGIRGRGRGRGCDIQYNPIGGAFSHKVPSSRSSGFGSDRSRSGRSNLQGRVETRRRPLIRFDAFIGIALGIIMCDSFAAVGRLWNERLVLCWNGGLGLGSD